MSNNQKLTKVELEIKLRAIEERFDRIIENAIRVGKSDDELLDLRRRLSVFIMFYEENIISVTGLQSTGKSTLVKSVFDLEDGILPIEAGVGEKRPLLIKCSHDIKKGSEKYFEAYLELENNRYVKKKNALNDKNLLREKLLNPEDHLLYLELWIPYNEILGERTLALLPGLERSKRSISQKFVDIYIENSLGLISTIRKDSLANNNQEKLLNKIYELYNDKPFSFVITFSNEVSNEERTQLENELKDKYNVSTKEQIIFTDTNEDLSKMKESFKNLIYNTLNDTNTLLNRQTDSIKNLIVDIENKLQEIYDEIKLESDFEGIKPKDKKLIKQFRSNKVKYLNEVEEALNIKMDNYINEMMSEIRKQIANEKKGVVESVLSVFKKDLTYKQKIEIKEYVEKEFSSQMINNQLVTPETIMIETINNINQNKLGNIYNNILNTSNNSALTNSTENIDQLKNNMTNELVEVSKKEVIKKQNPNNNFKNNVNEIIQNNLVNVTNYLAQTNEAVLKSDDLKTVPYLIGSIVQYQGSLNQTKSKNDSNNMLFDIFNENNLLESELSKDNKNILLNTKNILVGSSVFMGIDAADGQVNSLDALKNVAIGMGIPAKSILPVFLGTTILGTAAMSVHIGSRNIEGYKNQKDHIIDSLLINAKEHYVKNTIASIDSIFEMLESKILNKMNSIANSTGKLDAIMVLDNDLDIIFDRIKELEVEVYKLEGPRI
ncbi:hypothetical protein [Macrococcus capreoli]|uniref:hypothetical protein n=1 Tax=Macrococcus capreoli TaxID=2982690 RepID=UPI003EE5073D